MKIIVVKKNAIKIHFKMDSEKNIYATISSYIEAHSTFYISSKNALLKFSFQEQKNTWKKS